MNWLKNNKLKTFLAAILLWFGFCLIQVYTFSKEYHEVKSDVAIVLGAGQSNGVLSPIFEERMNHAIYLLNEGKVNVILITGGYGEGESISDSEAAKQYAIEKGVSEAKILLEETSTITFYNIKNAKEIMIEYDLKTALIVSDPYHMKRSLAMCNKMEIDALSSPTSTTMYRSYKTKAPFLVKQTWFYCLFLLIGQFRFV